jgi:CRP-like cAMP-binding protein
MRRGSGCCLEGRLASAQALEDALVARLPRLDITDLLIEVDAWTGYSL